jgi:hypothetical protein
MIYAALPREPDPMEVKFRDNDTPPGGWTVWCPNGDDGTFRWMAFSRGAGREGSVAATLKSQTEIRDMAVERARREYEALVA